MVWNLIPEVDNAEFVISGHGSFVNGKQHGHWKMVQEGVFGQTYEGPFVESEMHGRWVLHHESSSGSAGTEDTAQVVSGDT